MKKTIKNLKKAQARAANPEADAFPWAAVLELIFKLILGFLPKNQVEDAKAALTKAAKGYGGTPDEDKATAVRQVLQRAYDETRRVRVGRRAWLRWAIEELPPCCNMDKPKLSATQVSEAKQLAALDKG